MILSTIILGLVLGGSYALVALGLTLQYGIARIMNLAYGELLIAGCFAVALLFTGAGLSPLIALPLMAAAGYVVSWVLYAVMMRPLVARAGRRRGRLEVDSILATFGLLFLVQGVMLVAFGSDIRGYSFLNTGVPVLGVTVAMNRLLALALSLLIGVGLWLLMTRSRWGVRLRAVAQSPEAAPLVGIDVNRVARQGFALGGALAGAAGAVVSMYQTFSAGDGVIFTMKALVVVIMGGVGNVLGALLAGLFLGLVETFVASYVDPGLTLAATYGIFLAVLLWRPSGLFGRSA